MKKLVMQAVNFIGLSGIGWILDFITYTGLGMVSHNLILNNIISSWAGVTFVFIFATRTVFQSNSKISLRTKYVVYILYQCVLILLISKVLDVINTGIVNNVESDAIVQFSALIAKILVTPVTMTLNFFVMKGIIEKL